MLPVEPRARNARDYFVQQSFISDRSLTGIAFETVVGSEIQKDKIGFVREHVAIQAEHGRDDFILRRLLGGVPSYHRAPVAGRVLVVAPPGYRIALDYRMRSDGHLLPAR